MEIVVVVVVVVVFVVFVVSELIFRYDYVFRRVCVFVFFFVCPQL